MKIIDRYMLRSFLAPLAYCLLAFALVYVVFDLFDNLGDFLAGDTSILLVAKYYLILLPAVLVRFVPVSVLLAVMYALYNLSKSNELIALRASGVSLNRVMVPYIITGFLVSVAVLGINETIGPTSAYWCHKFVREQKKGNPDIHLSQISFKREKSNRFWFINRFDSRDFSMQGVLVSQMRDDGRTELSKLRAEGGQWLDGRWVFTNITLQVYDEDGSPRGAPEYIPAREMSDFSERPQDFLNEIKKPEFLSTAELKRYLRIHRNLEPQSVASTLTDMHSRLAFPWASLIVVLLGVPLGTHTGRKGVMPAIASSLFMLAGYYGLMMFGIFLGKNMIAPPIVGGWLPIAVFLLIGLVMLLRIR